MATATMPLQPDVLPSTCSHDDFPHSPSALPVVKEEVEKSSNGYVASPLRSSQRASSLGDNEFPDVPKGDVTSARTNGVHVGATTLPSAAPRLSSTDATNGATTDIPSPPRRPSVQFSRDAGGDEPSAPPNASAWEDEEEESSQRPVVKEKQGSFFGKLRAMAGSSPSTHARNTSTMTASAPSNLPLSPQSGRNDPSYPMEAVEDGQEADADEDSDEEVEELDTPQRRQQRSQRSRLHTAESAPSTPRMARLEQRFASFRRDQTAAFDDKSSPSRPTGRLSRRSTASDLNENAGVSEDEGRDRIRNAWRRGVEGARGLSYHARSKTDNETPEVKRPSHLRRITGLGSHADGPSTESPARARPDRQTTTSAQKWRQVKAGLKMLGQRRRDERMRVDHQKSAQLMAELMAGAPAALVLASMFQRDENKHRKIPVLLEQLKIRIPDSRIRKDKDGDRHLIFDIDLEYGNGPARMKWTIARTLKDFINLHARYQASAAKDKVKRLGGDNKNRAKMPRFPRGAFPYARGLRGLFDNLQDEEDEEEAAPFPGAAELGVVTESPMTPGPVTTPLVPGGSLMPITPGPNHVNSDGSGRHKRTKSSNFTPQLLRRSSTADMGPLPNDIEQLTERQRELYQRRQRRKLETYLQQMIRWLIFRPDSTRLCKFLEISALAIRLSAEGGYAGKQGLLTIASRRNKEVGRKRFEPSSLVERHHARWFLVRHSYVVCVDGPESLNPYDVFLIDSDFTTEKRQARRAAAAPADQDKNVAVTEGVNDESHRKHLLLRLYNSERKLRLLAKTERQFQQFRDSINLMAENSVWSKKQRFNSYAPVRNNVWCRWLVDGRDHTWQISRAIENAKDFIYIHGWWVTPELYLRRPAAISQKWRLDRLLQRKAQEGVKIFLIVYRNIESAMPIDSEYTKWSMLDLHENICIQRSPNQFRQNQFFWAHHEKMVIVDNMMAFVGGIDLCFGRWDEPSHTLTDDKLTGFELDHVGPRDSENCQMWPGKDYSNPRVQDFFALDRPYEEMYDRTRVPRMPWHDISMQMVGQPARDLARHFVQRWNYVLRSRIPSRPTPVLLPPPEYQDIELESLGMTGTCDVQILRSCAAWSSGTPNKVEHSIMNAYVHLIETSDHFVYIENQFFVSACVVEGTLIHNKIGDALVNRIIRAYENDEVWQACILIPLMPGFQNEVNSQDGTSVRLIMQCQFRSICRGDTSIFGRLRHHGIDPEDYIHFYSLRQWGKIGPRKCLTTEMLYIHAKCMIVDDRSVIIGSANINERSMLGSRDSELAALVTDTRKISSYMGGKPYEVGEFAHSLRMRLMREHLGIDVDSCYQQEQSTRDQEEEEQELARLHRQEALEQEDYFSPPKVRSMVNPLQTQRNADISSDASASNGTTATTAVGSTLGLEHAGPSDKKDRKGTVELQHDLDVDGYGYDNMKAIKDIENPTTLDSYVDARGREVLLKRESPDAQRVKSTPEEDKHHKEHTDRGEYAPAMQPPVPTERTDTYNLGLLPRSQLPELPLLDDTDIGGPAHMGGDSVSAKGLPPLAHLLKRPEITENCMDDPIATGFYYSIWDQVAENNTKIYRQVFRCMPDSEVLDWRTYDKYNEYNERFMQSQGLGSTRAATSKDAPDKSGPPGSAAGSIPSIIQPTGRARSKSVLSGIVEKIRPGSKTSDEPAASQESNEKDDSTLAVPNGAVSPDSPHSGTSSGPTAVPSPQTQPLDEKEAQKLADDAVAPKDYALPGPPSAHVDEEKVALKDAGDDDSAPPARRRTVQLPNYMNLTPETTTNTTTSALPPSSAAGLQHTGSQKRRRRGTTKSNARAVPEEVLSKEEAEGLLKLVQGHLVVWPKDWLEKEERNGNWLYNIDQLAPLEIYD